MKTAIQELINLLEIQRRLFAEAERHTLADGIGRTILLSKQFLEKEKEMIENAFDMGRDETTRNFIEDGEEYYNQKYNQTNVGNDGFEFDNSSTIPPTKGLCDAKSIYGSELNKELTLDERMHLWFESSRPNRDVCDYVDEMNDIDKAKYLDGCGISRTTKNK